MAAAESRAATTLREASDDRLREFVAVALPCRELVVGVSRADIRRLERSIRQINAASPDDPMNPACDIDLGIALMGAALRGLDANDADDGVWSGMDGCSRPLPPPNRSPWHKRAVFAWRAARTTWRAT